MRTVSSHTTLGTRNSQNEGLLTVPQQTSQRVGVSFVITKQLPKCLDSPELSPVCEPNVNSLDTVSATNATCGCSLGDHTKQQCNMVLRKCVCLFHTERGVTNSIPNSSILKPSFCSPNGSLSVDWTDGMTHSTTQ